MTDDDPSDYEMDLDWDGGEKAPVHRPIAVGMMRSDLRIAKAAGYKVGHLETLSGAVIVSLSCRIKKLELSSDAMQAWDVRPTDYLVLLIRYPQGYVKLDEILDSSSSYLTPLQMRVGLCDSYKPSLHSAMQLFIDEQAQFTSGTPRSDANDTPLMRPMFLAGSLKELLNSRFISLVRYRLMYGFSWTGAEKYFNDNQGKIKDFTEAGDSVYYVSENWDSSTPKFLVADHVTELKSSSQVSLPLVAIQYTLRRFAKCSGFCLNCHCKIDVGYESIKPYVCSNGLCLYQYMQLGMGPNIEWEIRSHPYVVDLLISFAYSRAVSLQLTHFPSGLGIKVPRIFDNDYPHSPFYAATLDASNMTILMEGRPDLRAGDWVLIIAREKNPKWRQQRCLHCRVKNAVQTPLIQLCDPNSQDLPHVKKQDISAVGKNVQLVVYDGNFDDIKSNIAKRDALVMLLDTLPSVEDMASFVDSNLNKSSITPLSSWKERISPSALDLLRWIVASNRSCIVYDDDPENQVTGMKDYVQFRLAQGAPDKERRFLNAVNATSKRLKVRNPTFFAWHGSAVHNWHSILREGLHFNNVVNGRAYGHGVYMSRSFTTSLQFTRAGMGSPTSDGIWPNSKLNIQAAVSLIEVVNAPKEFVHSQACYVVDKLDWIQPRYLFVHCKDSDLTAARSQKSPSVTVPQDSNLVAYGPHGGAIAIPISAVGSHRIQSGAANKQGDRNPLSKVWKRVKKRGPSRKGKTSKTNTLPDAGDQVAGSEGDSDADSVTTLAEDREFLQLDKDTMVVEADETDNVKSRKDEYLTKTDFRPGTLKESSLRLLGSPKYATVTGSQTIQRRLQEALKVQDREPLQDLGWYIDKDLINNMYQWIVELHSFNPELPLAKDLKKAKLTSIVLELRFPSDFPNSPPFVRIIRPRMLPWRMGGGGHVTAGGAMCMELLTNSGWTPATSIENLLVQVHMALSNPEPVPARLENGSQHEYSVTEAVDAYKRVCNLHEWRIPADINQIVW